MTDKNEPVIPILDTMIPASYALPYHPTQLAYFAAKAMKAFIIAGFSNVNGGGAALTDYCGKTVAASPSMVAAQSLLYADALIAALKESEGV